MLALYGPLCLVLLPFAWIALIVTGFTLMMWGFGVEPWREAFILSGSSIFTLGFAAPDSLPVDVLVFVEAFLGLGLVALGDQLPAVDLRGVRAAGAARRSPRGAGRQSPVSCGDAHAGISASMPSR